jgi:hypothetical protein
MTVNPDIGVLGHQDHGATTLDANHVDGAGQLELFIPTQINGAGFFDGCYHARRIGGRIDATAKGGMDRFATQADAKDVAATLTNGQCAGGTRLRHQRTRAVA